MFVIWPIIFVKKIRDTGTIRQKGVDTLIAIDILSKAYQDQFDITIIVTGDEDFLPVIDYVKNTGKRIYGVFFENLFSQDLEERLDNSFIITYEWLYEQNLRKNIQFKYNNKIEKDNFAVDIEIEMLVNQISFSLILSFLGIDRNDEIIECSTTDLSADMRQQLNRNDPNATNIIKIKKTMTLSKKDYPIKLLLLSSRKDFLRNTKFRFDFKEDYLYRVVN